VLRFIQDLANIPPPPPSAPLEVSPVGPSAAAGVSVGVRQDVGVRQELAESSSPLDSLPPSLRARAREFLKSARALGYDMSSAYRELMKVLADYGPADVQFLEGVVGAASLLMDEDLSPAAALRSARSDLPRFPVPSTPHGRLREYHCLSAPVRVHAFWQR